MTTNGIKISIVHFDNDLVGLEIIASNSTFRAQANVYADHNVFRMICDVLQGFPKDLADKRGFVLGTFDTNKAGGGARLQFRCLNASGHCEVVTNIHTGSHSEPSANATFAIPIEAAGIDKFVEQLLQMRIELRQQATLLSVGSQCGSPDGSEK